MDKLFTPISVGLGLLAGIVANKVFTRIWAEIIDEEPPDPKHREISGWQLVGALLLQGAIQRLIRGGVDHGLRHAFARRQGIWPGEERPQPE